MRVGRGQERQGVEARGSELNLHVAVSGGNHQVVQAVDLDDEEAELYGGHDGEGDDL